MAACCVGLMRDNGGVNFQVCILAVNVVLNRPRGVNFQVYILAIYVVLNRPRGVNFQVYILAVYVAMRPDNAEQGQHAGRVRLAPFAKLPRGGGRRSWLPT